MNILFDLYTTQHFIGGGAEYIRKVFYSVLDAIDGKNDIRLFGLHSSKLNKYAYADLNPEAIITKGVTPVDAANSSLKRIITEYQIDKVFIGVAQYWGKAFDVQNIKVPCICVVHDLCMEDYEDSQVPELLNLPWGWYLFNRKRLGWHKRRILGQWKDPLLQMKNIMEMAHSNDNVQFITVSDYSLRSFQYHFDYPINRVKVLYSCPRVNLVREGVEDSVLKEVISSGKKYYLMLSANRDLKNPKHTFNAFRRFVECGHKDAFLLTTGCKERMFDNHIPLGYICDNDLVLAMKHCYALLFPSFMEGFGYPPIEAMEYGKPVLCSNVTSIPEICGGAAIYFSPLYESDIFRCLHILNDSNYDEYAEKSRKRYLEVNKRQKEDLKTLVKLILE